MPPKLTLVFLLAIHQLLGQIDLGRILPVAQPLHVTVIGDFGSGTQHQADVAQALQRRNAQLPFQLGLTVGDNFYRCGVRSIYDRKWITRWENFYTRLGFPFYATLGNHDYGRPLDCVTRSGSPDAQVAYTAKSKSWRMPARYYTFAAGAARFFALDTESWPGAQLRWLKEALEASQHEPGIRWRIIYGHHPVLSSGHHANQKNLIDPLREQLGRYWYRSMWTFISAAMTTAWSIFPGKVRTF